MRQIFILFSVLLVISACEKNNNTGDTEYKSVYGRYIGTFHRTGMDTVEVQLGLLSDNTFEGSSTRNQYPAICSGYFTYDNSSRLLTVRDTCAWTANFDWTLIFDGSYNVSFPEKNTLRIWRTNGVSKDEYLLNKLVR